MNCKYCYKTLNTLYFLKKHIKNNHMIKPNNNLKFLNKICIYLYI